MPGQSVSLKAPSHPMLYLYAKKDGSLRFCSDYRKLNNRTVKDAYYLPRIEETIDTLSGSKYFSKLDLRSGYWQVGVKESDKMKTAFSVGPLGTTEWPLAFVMHQLLSKD